MPAWRPTRQLNNCSHPGFCLSASQILAFISQADGSGDFWLGFLKPIHSETENEISARHKSNSNGWPVMKWQMQRLQL
jgi:hypothetical protein